MARLWMSGVSLAYGDTQALQDVELEVAAGEVHALLGENGAGKSSLMKVLAGAERADAGSMQLDGEPYAPRDPLAAVAAGVAMIYQELTVLPHLTVAENVQLGRESAALLLRIDRRARATAVGEVLALLQRHDLPQDRLVRELSPADRQMVEIARALLRQARVLVMDEPTSSLGAADQQRLFAVVRELRGRGLAIVYISHFLEEVRAIGDRFTVLRDGRSVHKGALAAVDDAELVRQMTGRPLASVFPARRGAAGATALRCEQLAGVGGPTAATFDLHAGEILGVGGLCGAGRTELLEVLFGLRPRRSGTVELAGAPAPATPVALWRAGVGLVVEDRKLQGLSVQRSLAENLVLPSAAAFRRRGLLSRRAVRLACSRWIEALSIRCRSAQQRVGLLSGGNQQKVALARLLQANSRIVLLDEPTRGVDVGSRHEIYALLDQLARDGAAILLVSSQLPELLGLCDRVAVMARGVLGLARPATDWTAEQLLHAAIGGEAAA
jgi:ribose transport system ATP-binding protein